MTLAWTHDEHGNAVATTDDGVTFRAEPLSPVWRLIAVHPQHGRLMLGRHTFLPDAKQHAEEPRNWSLLSRLGAAGGW